MRLDAYNGHIGDTWRTGGPFIGATGKPNTVVTVQQPWADIATDPENVIFDEHVELGVMRTRGYPIRWYQKLDESQLELEIPNVKSVSIDRSVDQDAGTCQVSIYNQWMYANGAAPVGTRELGQPGYFTPTRGESPETFARWGHTSNSWSNVLVSNAIIRTYQGYGGHSKTLTQAIVDGNLILSGVWLVDDVTVSTSGVLDLACRDMAKLLIDQQLFPPLVPAWKYPLSYYRYAFDDRQVTSNSGVFTADNPALGTPNTTVGERAITYLDSSQDRWYGPNASIHGHRGSDAIDGLDTTYALSVGNSGPDKAFATVWWEFGCGDWVNAIYLHPWSGGYTMYVSVYEDGAWQGDQTIPYDYRPLVGTQPTVVDTQANIAYVASFQIPVETSGTYTLPRLYSAEKIRITFRHLADSNVGPWEYRAGIREVQFHGTAGAGNLAVQSAPGVIIEPITYAADGLRDLDDLNRWGYITVSNFGDVDVFGDCREYDLTGGDGGTTSEVASVSLAPTGDGYVILQDHGEVNAYGSMQDYGSATGLFTYTGGLPDGGINKAATIVVTPSGLGYWVITWKGEIFSFGDAEDFADQTITGKEFFHGAAGHPGAQGLYLIRTDGVVVTLGAAVYRGDFNKYQGVSNEGQQEIAIDICPTGTGNGYWILTTAGRVQGLGDATDWGEITIPDFAIDVATQTLTSLSSYDRYYQIMGSPDDGGYLINDGDGKIRIFGDVLFFGSPVKGTVGQLRKDGNYLDFADIVRDLVLWSGFYLKGSLPGYLEDPDVYGNIEDTGTWSPEQLPDEMFDKKPVIDAIKELKEAVGYIAFVDDEGGFRFESPNWWEPGNVDQATGAHTTSVFEIDESVNMTDYQVTTSDNQFRSYIIIASEDPVGSSDDTIYTVFRPNTADSLRGLIKPSMWINGFFQKKSEQAIMAELIALHIWFAQRQGQVSCVANPAIQINDQVRIFERITGESYLHYVRGIQTTHDLDSGVYTMSLTTHWLGDGDDWVITNDSSHAGELGYFVINPTIVDESRSQTPIRSGTVRAPE